MRTPAPSCVSVGRINEGPPGDVVTMMRPNPDRDRLLPWRYSLCAVGTLHTLLCAGVVFGWSSLEAVLREEKTFGGEEDDNNNPEKIFALVFTLGAVGNYVANLPFGALLDAKGPRCVCSKEA
jgi:hypothetical protein